MNRKKILVLDVETCNDLDYPLVYDIGFAVTDKYGKIYEKQSFIIYETFVCEKVLMNSCYYAAKIPKYEKQIKAGLSKLVTWWTAWRTIQDIMEKYGITTVAAYNCYFDRKALNTTMRFLTKSKYRYFFNKKIKFICIWHMACQVLYTQKTFIQWALKNGFTSPTGNIMTSAEIGWRYHTGQLDFEEEHQGLQDVEIEVQIMKRCFQQHKKMNQNINRLCWKIPQKRKKEIGF